MILTTELFRYNTSTKDYKPVPEEFKSHTEFSEIWSPLFLLESYHQLQNLRSGGSKMKTASKAWNCSLESDEESHHYLNIKVWEPHSKFDSFKTNGR